LADRSGVVRFGVASKPTVRSMLRASVRRRIGQNGCQVN
jgi:hypothetical protein